VLLGNSSQRLKTGKEQNIRQGIKFNLWSEERMREAKCRCRI